MVRCRGSPFLRRSYHAVSTVHRGERFTLVYSFHTDSEMRVIEFIEGPCRWDWRAPARLREQAFGDASAWRSYSTSRFLDGSNPHILDTIEFFEHAVDSAVSVEWLPPVLADQWRNVGLEFASEAELSDMEFRQTLVSSLDFIGMDHTLEGTVAGLCRSLHVLIASGGDCDVSYSDPSLPLSVFVSCPLPAERNRVERLAENIVHEALHLQLSLVESVQPLVIDDPDEEPVFSPWKEEVAHRTRPRARSVRIRQPSEFLEGRRLETARILVLCASTNSDDRY